MEKSKKVTLQPLTQATPPDDTELNEAALDEINGGAKKTSGNSWYAALAKAFGEALNKQASKL